MHLHYHTSHYTSMHDTYIANINNHKISVNQKTVTSERPVNTVTSAQG